MTLEMTGHVTAVFDGERPIIVEASDPFHEPLEPVGPCGYGELAEHPTRGGFDRDGGMGLLVRVDSHYDHLWSPFLDGHTGW